MASRPRKQAAQLTKTLEQRLWDTADALRGNQEPSMESDLIDPATENWKTKDDAELWHAVSAGVPQAMCELARRETERSAG